MSKVAGIFASVLLLAAASTASAQSLGVDSRPWEAAIDGTGAFTTYGSDALAEKTWRFSYGLDYSSDPVVLTANGQPVATLVDDMLTMELGVAFGLGSGWQLEAALPLSISNVRNPFKGDRQEGASSSGLRDMRVGAKWSIIPAQEGGVGIAAVGQLILPTGDSESWRGAGSVQPSVFGVAELALGPVSVVGNLGYRFHPSSDQVFDDEADDAIIYRGGAVLDTGVANLVAVGEIYAETMISGPTQSEVGFGARMGFAEDWELYAGMNIGLGDSVGTPTWRAHAGIGWRFAMGADPQSRPMAAQR